MIAAFRGALGNLSLFEKLLESSGPEDQLADFDHEGFANALTLQREAIHDLIAKRKANSGKADLKLANINQFLLSLTFLVMPESRTDLD